MDGIKQGKEKKKKKHIYIIGCLAKNIYRRKVPGKVGALCPPKPWKSSGLRSDI